MHPAVYAELSMESCVYYGTLIELHSSGMQGFYKYLSGFHCLILGPSRGYYSREIPLAAKISEIFSADFIRPLVELTFDQYCSIFSQNVKLNRKILLGVVTNMHHMGGSRWCRGCAPPSGRKCPFC
jgi:hypothetical protein